MPSRRDLLRAGAAWGGLAWLGDTARLFERLATQPLCPEAGPLGELVAVVPFMGERGAPTPLGTMVGGTGLDARLFTDLSDLQPDRLITPAARVFIRTAGPTGAKPIPPDRWSIAIIGGGRFTKPPLPASDLIKVARPMGAHLIECAGNSDPQNFGLMSVAEWDGVPLTEVLTRADPRSGAAGVLVTGWDHEGQASARSIPGASWILPLAPLERLGAFLAVRMNGQPLSLDHGAPVRLVVPGWYGCSWIKWVNEIRLVDADQPPTTQMLEFATRTHQDGTPARALAYAPPSIDLAATPIRIEKRRIDGRLEYRIVGIVWGGERPVDRLMIRFGPSDPFKPFALCPAPKTNRIWSVWEYRWRPAAPGVYSIVLQVADPAIRARRLDLSFYIRRVAIDET